MSGRGGGSAGTMIRAATIIVLLATAAPVLAQRAPACPRQAEFAQLDFWLGRRNVFVQGQKVGENRIEKTGAGCVVTEDWADARRRRGHNLFHVDPATEAGLGHT